MFETENLSNGHSSTSGQLPSSNDMLPVGSEQSSLTSDQTPCRNDEPSSENNDEPSIKSDQSPRKSETSLTENDQSVLNSDQTSIGSEQNLPLINDQLSVTNDQSLLESELFEDAMEVQETLDPTEIGSTGVSVDMVGITKSVNPVVQQQVEVNSNSNPFAEYEWMGQEEEFDKKVLAELEEEEFIEICFEEMLAEEEADCFYPPIDLQLPYIEKVQEVESEQVMEHVGHDESEMSEETHECEETSDFILGSSPQR